MNLENRDMIENAEIVYYIYILIMQWRAMYKITALEYMLLAF